MTRCGRRLALHLAQPPLLLLPPCAFAYPGQHCSLVPHLSQVGVAPARTAVQSPPCGDTCLTHGIILGDDLFRRAPASAASVGSDTRPRACA
ncbi:hypothetical protein SEVIR_3G019550v4 [Setaria viridis]